MNTRHTSLDPVQSLIAWIPSSFTAEQRAQAGDVDNCLRHLAQFDKTLSCASNHRKTFTRSCTCSHQILFHPLHTSFITSCLSKANADLIVKFLFPGFNHPTWSTPSRVRTLVPASNNRTVCGSLCVSSSQRHPQPSCQ